MFSFEIHIYIHTDYYDFYLGLPPRFKHNSSMAKVI